MQIGTDIFMMKEYGKRTMTTIRRTIRREKFKPFEMRTAEPWAVKGEIFYGGAKGRVPFMILTDATWVEYEDAESYYSYTARRLRIIEYIPIIIWRKIKTLFT